MRRTIKLLILFCLCYFNGVSQTVSDVLTNGKKVKSNSKLILQVVNNSIEYCFTDNDEKTNFLSIRKTDLFLSKDNQINVFIKPFNPLNFSIDGKQNLEIDKIDETASTALGAVIKLISNIEGKLKEDPLPPPLPPLTSNTKGNKKNTKNNTIKSPTIDANTAIVDARVKKENEIRNEKNTILRRIKFIQEKIQIDKKEKIKEIFISLKKLSFDVEKTTNDAVNQAIADYNMINNFFTVNNDSLKNIRTDIEVLNKKITSSENTDLEPLDLFIYAVNDILAKQQTLNNENEKRLKNLKKIIDFVKNEISGYSKNWLKSLDRISIEKGKITNYSLKVSTDGYKLDENSEIISEEKKLITDVKFVFRKYQLWVPEISAGVAYTNLSFPKFGIDTDTTSGKQTVADAGQEMFKKVNFSTMINWNIYLPDWDLLPFIQLGTGVNAAYPTIFLGGGFRFKISNNQFAISYGLAGSWTKSLSTLKIGDKVTGTAQLEKDIIYDFKKSAYFGIQYNF